MAGHMQHPPFPIYQWISDFWWMACLAAVCAFSFRLKAKRKRWFFYGGLLLIISRILLGSLGGGNIIFELPILITMDVFAIKYLLKPEKYIISGEKKSGQVSSDGAPSDEPSTSTG